MEGFFFSSEETQVKKPMLKMSGCGACKLHRGCNTPRMEAAGKGEKKILIIAEAPGASEDRRGVPMVGEAGQLLRDKLKWLGIDLDRDCRKINAVSCRPPENRTPTPFEVECCRPRVWKEIEEFQPKLILLLGGSAVVSFLGHRWKKELGGILKWRGWTIPDRETKCWVCPTFHPSYVMKGKEKVLDKVWELDLEQALSKLKEPCPIWPDEESGVEIVEERELHNRLRNIREWAIPFAFDYETTGLKPHAKGHKIVTMSIATQDTRAFAFFMPEEGPTRRLLRRIMLEPEIGKMAHNIKFEDNWTNVLLPSVIEGWIWDSMLAAHILDNREGITGLKFQSYVHFGVVDYSSHLDQYIHVPDKKGKSGNDFNRIFEAPKRELLVYNAVDSMLEFRLARMQMRTLGFDNLLEKMEDVPF